MRWFACPICTLISRDRALCDHCADELYHRRVITQRDLGAYRTRSLFAWRRDDWLGLRWWAMALKQKEHDAFWREAATWLIDAFGAPGGDVELVPVPTSHSLNHARGLARALALRSEATVRDVLRPRRGGHQRRLDRSARQARRFDLDEDQMPPRGRVIVLDDIITSGATAEAAFRALGQPASCEVWCLMDRNTPGR